jgi:acyl-CoA synthetase (AMP-forming)/AMP-acid ligase II
MRLRDTGADEFPRLPDLVAFLEGSGLAGQKFPEHVEVMADLPRTASGKVRKDILRRMIADKVRDNAAPKGPVLGPAVARSDRRSRS